jgi:hypothetical protein
MDQSHHCIINKQPFRQQIQDSSGQASESMVKPSIMITE